ncbi:MAG: M48 family metalloprotease [Treponema sp.]|jgi:predicted Zn-dependent protease|nr:M48 family metalloprotease [Treponema sp.]
MKKYFSFIILVLILVFGTCKHIDTVAQIAAEGELIDQHTANTISLTARAFEAATERITPDQEYFIGRAVAANILSTYRIWNGNPALTKYLNLICAAIILNSPQPTLYNGYHIAILDTNEVNAFATSGGHIFLTRGLVNAAKSEEALAGVIAHEVAHIQLKHGINAIKTNRVTEALLLTATAGIGAVTGLDANELTDILNESVGEIFQTMVNSGYSKEQEFEADTAAMYLMVAAGYDPSGLIEMLSILETGTKMSRLNMTHPSPVQRVYYANRVIGRLEIAETDPSRQQRFNAIVNPRVSLF